MNNVTHLSLSADTPVASVVELLEDMLARAQTGEIRGVAIACVTTDRCTSTAFERGDGSIAMLMASTLYLQHRLVEHEG